MKKSIISLLLVVVLLVPNFVFAEAELNFQQEQKADIIFFEEIFNLVRDSYPFEVDDSKLIEEALKGMLKSIDPYSNYYTKDEAEAILAPIYGNFSGIGVYIEEKDGYINVVDTIKGQPAEKVGIKKGDLIISVNDADIKGIGIDKSSAMIKGPKGTTVKIGIKRGEKLLTFEVTRDTITINPVEYKVLEKNIGYIYMEEFNSQATREVKKALKEFDSKGITKIILDLRDNPGGLFNEALSIARLFVPSGAIVHVKEKNRELITHRSYQLKSKYSLAVLINENSASASEIVAGAVKDRKAGTLIGTKTFGKGIIQSLIPISDGSMVKLTTAEYLTPNKTSIHNKGIEPNIKVTNTEKEDLQLKKAIEILK